MDIGFSNVNRMTPPQTAGVGEAASRRLSEGDAGRIQTAERRFPEECGFSEELAPVAGEERVDEAALRRDDDLGNLVSKAFDPETAAAALPPLGIGETTASSVAAAKDTAAALQAMAESSYETSQTIIGNMVDTPEERAAKAEREAERQAKEFDEKTRLEEQTEKEFQNTRILDEIAASRLATERS